MLPLIGTDIIHTTRLTQRSPAWLRALAIRILHPTELISLTHQSKEFANFHTLFDPKANHPQHYSTPSRVISLIAGRWAAKEAARKAWGANLIGFRDVRLEVVRDTDADATGSSQLKVMCQPIEHYSRKGWSDGGQEGRVSLSHDGEYTIASVICEPLGRELMDEFVKRRKESTMGTFMRETMDQKPLNDSLDET